jgi:hypothetical protein
MIKTVVLLLSLLALSACAPDNNYHKIISYGGDGGVLHVYYNHGPVVTTDGIIRFVDLSTGHKIKICGQVVVETLEGLPNGIPPEVPNK